MGTAAGRSTPPRTQHSRCPAAPSTGSTASTAPSFRAATASGSHSSSKRGPERRQASNPMHGRGAPSSPRTPPPPPSLIGARAWTGHREVLVESGGWTAHVSSLGYLQSFGRGQTNKALGEHLDATLGPGGAVDENDAYLFARGIPGESLPVVAAGWNNETFGPWAAAAFPPSAYDSVVTIGRREHGIPLHRHYDAWLMLLYGRKRCRPPHSAGSGRPLTSRGRKVDAVSAQCPCRRWLRPRSAACRVGASARCQQRWPRAAPRVRAAARRADVRTGSGAAAPAPSD